MSKEQKSHNTLHYLRGAGPLLLLLLWLQIPGSLQGQNRWVREGDNYLAEKNFAKAIEMYEWALRKDDYPKAQAGLVQAYRSLKQYAQAEKWGRILMQNPGISPEHYFLMGQVLLSRTQYKEAKYYFQRYFEAHPEDPRRITFQDFNQKISALIGDSSIAQLSKAPFCNQYAEYSPQYLPDGLLLVSNRPRQVGVVFQSKLHEGPMSDLYQVEWKADSSWGKVQVFPSLNSVLNEGPATLDSSYTYMLFTRNDPKMKRRSVSQGRVNALQLYEATLQEEKWVEQRPFSHNLEDYSTGHPSLSADGQSLIFASDRPGGLGGSDLWISYRQGDSWSEPQNLGPPLNTPNDEVFPYLHSSGILYFASDGHLGLGGLDLFSSRPLTNSWSVPLNMGFPYNSSADDFGIILDPERKNGFLSSDRGGNDDIWSFQSSLPDFDCQPQQKNVYCYTFYDRGAIDTDTLPFVYEWHISDGTVIRGLSAYHCFEGPGDYRVELNLIDSVTGFVFMHEASYDLRIRDIEQVFIACPDTILLGETVTLSGEKSQTPGGEILEYYWDLGGGYLKSGPSLEHRFFEEGLQEIRLGVVCLAEGSTERFTRCISKKIQVVKEWIQSPDQKEDFPEDGGLDIPDVKKQGNLRNTWKRDQLLDFLQPHVTGIQRDHTDLVRDSVFYLKDTQNDEWYRLTIREKSDPQLLAPQANTYLLDLPDGPIVGVVEEVGKDIPLEFLGQKEPKAIEISENIRAIPVSTLLGEGVAFRLDNIQFDFGSAELTANSYPIIDKLAQLLEKYPDYRLEIQGHTDDIGSESFNEDLSKRRASAVFKAMVLRGNASLLQDIQIKGYGESSPLVPNTSPENRKVNRRVEFRLIPR